MESFPSAMDGDHTPTLAEDPALGLSHRSKMEILFAVMLGLFLGALDQTIVGPALPTIVTQLSGNDYYVWAITIYLLTSTISVPFWGKASDLYGRKPIYMLGIVVFLVGSALSGLSQNMAMLILFRGIQGIGAGALFPVALAIIGDLFTPQERGKYQGLFGAVFGIAFVVGPLIGGFLTENFGWHWIFYVNIPIGIVALIVIQRLLPTVKNDRASRNFDIVGGAIFAVSMVFLLVGLTNKGLNNPVTHALNDWTEPAVGGFILIGLIGTLIFLFAESRAKEPIVPLDLWRSRTYSASMVSTFFAAFAFFGAIVFLPRWFQVVEGFSPTNSGLAALPLMVGLIFSSIVSGFLVSRTGRYKWLLVGSITLMGLATLFMTQLTKDTPVPIVWLWMLLAGLGVGPTFSVFTIVIQNAVPFQQLGVATSNLTFFRQIGGTIALAFVGTIFATSFQEQLLPQMTAAGVPKQVTDGFPGRQQQRCRRLQPADRGRRHGRGAPCGDPGAVPGGRRTVHRRDGRGHPRGVQPRDGPDLLARRRSGPSRRSSPRSRSRRSRSAPRTSNPSPPRRSRMAPSHRRCRSRPPHPRAAPSRPRSRPRPGRPRSTDHGFSSLPPAPAGPRGRRALGFPACPSDPPRSRHASSLRAWMTRHPTTSRSSTRPSCPKDRCAGSPGATSTSSSRTRHSASSRPTTAARTCPHRCRSASSTAASWPVRCTRAGSTSRAATRPACRRPAAWIPMASTTRRGRRPAATRRSIRPGRRPTPGG